MVTYLWLLNTMMFLQLIDISVTNIKIINTFTCYGIW